MNYIKEALSNIIEGNLDAMRQNFSSALMEKAVQKLEEKKIDIAESYFAQIDEQQLTPSQAVDYGRGLSMANKPFGRPGFNMGGRTAMTGSGTTSIPGAGGTAKVTANVVDDPKNNYNQSTVTATRPSGSPIASMRSDAAGPRLTSVGTRRVNEESKEDDEKNEREEKSVAIPPRKMLVRKMKKA